MTHLRNISCWWYYSNAVNRAPSLHHTFLGRAIVVYHRQLLFWSSVSLHYIQFMGERKAGVLMVAAYSNCSLSGLLHKKKSPPFRLVKDDMLPPVQILKKVCWYAVLSPSYSTAEGSSSDVLTLVNTTMADKKLSDLPLLKQLLTTFTNPEIIRWGLFEAQFGQVGFPDSCGQTTP